ncbi:MAG TPA: Clp protease N-terminal domain-containing protein [Gemmatimonadaceae bacterium]|nr:Clp protease N-terminal domain-containing protein [Gemmatimonadaceae bacterium]
MNGYNFTERVRKVLTFAREEAARLHSRQVDTEHVLLGLFREGEGVSSAVLKSLHLDCDAVRRRIEEAAQSEAGTGTPAKPPELPYTPGAKKVLEMAMFEAHDMNHSYVGTEHILLGLLREGKGLAARELNAEGLTLSLVWDETLRLLGAELSAQKPKPEAGVSQPDELLAGAPGDETAQDWIRAENPMRALAPRSYQVLLLAHDEAERLHATTIGPEHLLLGILRQQNGPAARVLAESGLTLDAARSAIERLS